MKILHTSDLHLGKSLYGKNRGDEFAYILDTLLDTVEKEHVDVLLIAGDIFDTTMPPNDAQNLYYNFIYKLSLSSLKHTVIIAGNHDSPSFLDAPRILLENFKVSVISSADINNIDKEIICIKDEDGSVNLIVCAIPYLRERDLNDTIVSYDSDDREKSYRDSVKAHIKAVTDKAFAKAHELEAKSGIKVPVVAMAHLFCSGGITLSDDGVRDLFVGNLGHIEASVFDQNLAYVALGHLHVPQMVSGHELAYYSGSPLAMGFSEHEDKHFNLCTIDDNTISVSFIDIKPPKKLEQIKGNLKEIEQSLLDLSKGGESILCEIILSGSDEALSIKKSLEAIIDKSLIEILRIKDMRDNEVRMIADKKGELLDSLDELSVFKRLLAMQGINDEKDKEELIATYTQLRRAMSEEIV